MREGHFMSAEVWSRVSSLRSRRGALDAAWSARARIYEQHLDALLFLRDADALDQWIAARCASFISCIVTLLISPFSLFFSPTLSSSLFIYLFPICLPHNFFPISFPAVHVSFSHPLSLFTFFSLFIFTCFSSSISLYFTFSLFPFLSLSSFPHHRHLLFFSLFISHTLNHNLKYLS